MVTEEMFRWTPIPADGVDASASQLRVSNERTTLPLDRLLVLEDFLQGVSTRNGENAGSTPTPAAQSSWQGVERFVSHHDAPIAAQHDLVKDLDEALKGADYYYEGFHGPRRDCCSFSDVSVAPIPLQTLHQRFSSVTGLHATAMKVEEYIPQLSKVDGSTQDFSLVYTFPIHPGKDFTQREIDDAFVAELAYVPSSGKNGATYQYELFQAWNKPLDGQLMAWKLNGDDDWTDIKFPLGTMIVRRGTILKEWRVTSFLARPTVQQCKQPPRIRVIRFLRLPCPDRPCRQPSDTYFGYIPSPQDGIRRKERDNRATMPRLSELLTIVITTSPTPSNPNTELLETAMATFLHGGEEFAYDCPKVIMCDGVREGEAVSRKHATTKQAMRNGIVTSDQAGEYTEYKGNIRRLAETATPLSTFANTTVVELEERHGFGFSLRHAIRNHVATPFVCVVQHDRTFLRNTPVVETVRAMWRHANIKYVGFNMKSNLTYRDIFQTKYGNGKHHQQEFDDMILRLPELRLSGADFGPDSRSVKSMADTPHTRKVLGWAKSYAESCHGRHIIENAEANEEKGKYCQLSLIPTLFWFDNTHICDTSHYREFIFEDAFRQVARGGFVEDKVSPVLKKTCERLGLREGFSRYGCYLLDDHSGIPFTSHLDGGKFVPLQDKSTP